MLKVQQIEPSKLKPWEDNPRINDEAVDVVAESIKSFGFNVPILCDQELTIIAGHTRWKAANKIGMNSVPVIILELSEAQREAFAIADNKTGEIADWDYSRLREILEKLKRKKIHLPSLGYSQGELHALLTPQKEFDWKAFEERFKSKLTSMYVFFPIKVSLEMKDLFKRAIKELADEQGIKEKDPAKAAGQVIAFLLGVSQ
ncbi:ParB N-terminal domain-containing protein [bacterium]|nr:ParB N-terminal domain-containing protein [bacterium]